MKEDFMMTVKKAIVDFVLRDPTLTESVVDEFDSRERSELKEMSKIFKKNYLTNHAKIERILHVVNPCIAALIDLWYQKYRYILHRIIVDLTRYFL